MADEVIQNTIAKLLAKAKGTKNKHEAEAFMAKAQELLARHNLDEAQIAARDASYVDPIVEHRYRLTSVAKWRQYIANGCAKLYFCKLIMQGSEVIFVGKLHNAEVAASMTDWLCNVVVRMAGEFTPDRKKREDFKRGAAIQLAIRLKDLYEEQVPPQPRSTIPPATESISGLPALYKGEAELVDDYLGRQYGQLRTRKSRGIQTKGIAGAVGYAKAKDVELTGQAAETRSSRMIGRS